MLDSLLDGMKGQIAGVLAEKTGIDLGQAEQTVPLAGESIKEGIMGAVTGGKTDDVMSMFSSLTGSGGGGGALGALAGLAGGGNSGGMMQNAVFSGIANNFMGKLTGQLGLPDGIANTVSTMALPMIMSKIKGAASNEGGGLDASSLLKVMGGGDAASLLSGLAGGNNASGGITDTLKNKAADVLKDKLGGLLG